MIGIGHNILSSLIYAVADLVVFSEGEKRAEERKKDNENGE
jgi:hypothetical protein